MDPGEMTAQERAALALWLLMQGPMSTAAVAARIGTTREHTRITLAMIARVVPIYYDCHTRTWQLCKSARQAGGA